MKEKDTKLTKREANWLQKFNEAEADNPISQAKAWVVIHHLCVELGMYEDTRFKDLPGIVRVCEFIYKNAKRK